MTEHSNEIIDIKACKRNGKPFRAALVSFFALALVCGVIYPLAVTGVSKLMFAKKAAGSIITVKTAEGEDIYGSTLMGQDYTKPIYLVGRINSKAPDKPFAKKRRFYPQYRSTKTILCTKRLCI